MLSGEGPKEGRNFMDSAGTTLPLESSSLTTLQRIRCVTTVGSYLWKKPWQLITPHARNRGNAGSRNRVSLVRKTRRSGWENLPTSQLVEASSKNTFSWDKTSKDELKQPHRFKRIQQDMVATIQSISLGTATGQDLTSLLTFLTASIWKVSTDFSSR